MTIIPAEGASFDSIEVLGLRRAYDIARRTLSPHEPLDEILSRKLALALIRYARMDGERGPEEIARLAVIHVQLASAPLEF